MRARGQRVLGRSNTGVLNLEYFNGLRRIGAIFSDLICKSARNNWDEVIRDFVTKEEKTMNRTIRLLSIVAALSFTSALPAAAASKPASTGQPGNPAGVFCGLGTATSQPTGFFSSGFAIAGAVYAGTGASSISMNPKALSEYDIACYQVTQRP